MLYGVFLLRGLPHKHKIDGVIGVCTLTADPIGVVAMVEGTDSIFRYKLTHFLLLL
jgi:hypothetical protein